MSDLSSLRGPLPLATSLTRSLCLALLSHTHTHTPAHSHNHTHSNNQPRQRMSTTLADLSGLQGMLAQLSGNNAAADPLVVQPGDTDTQGMSFAELFRCVQGGHSPFQLTPHLDGARTAFARRRTALGGGYWDCTNGDGMDGLACAPPDERCVVAIALAYPRGRASGPGGSSPGDRKSLPRMHTY